MYAKHCTSPTYKVVWVMYFIYVCVCQKLVTLTTHHMLRKFKTYSYNSLLLCDDNSVVISIILIIKYILYISNVK